MIHLWLWLLVTVPILLLHFRGPDIGGRHAVSAVSLWDHAIVEIGGASGRRKFRDAFSLILHLTIAAVLISMMSLGSTDSDGKNIDRVVILDTSTGMTATEKGVPRIELAREHALNFLSTLPPGDPVALMNAAREPRVVCRKSVDRAKLVRAVKELQASEGASRSDDAVRLGKRILTEQSIDSPSERRIVFVTDGCGEFDWLSSLPEEGVQWILVGADDAPNRGITLFQTRRRLNDPDVCDAFCRLMNSDSVSAELQLDLHLDGTMLDTVSCRIEAHSSATKEFTFRERNGGELRLSIRRSTASRSQHQLGDDALSADDYVIQQLDPVPRIPVTLVSSQNRYLRAALESLPEVHLTILEEVPNSREPEEIIFVHRREQKNLPGGRIVVIDPQSATDLWEFQGRVVQPHLQALDKGSPLFRDVSMESLLIAAAPVLRPQQPVEILGSYSDGTPFCFIRRRDDGDVIVMAADIDESLMTFRAAFPVLVRNILRYHSSVPVRSAGPFASRSSQGAHVPDESETAMKRASPLKNQIAEPYPVFALRSASISGILLLALLLAEWVLLHRQKIRPFSLGQIHGH